MKFCGTCPSNSARGFSLVELILVVAIIGIMAAVGLPSILGYVKVYKIRGASQEVAGEIQTARMKAINRNVNFGVVFVTLPADPLAYPPGTPSNRYRWVYEDLPAWPDPWIGPGPAPPPPAGPPPLAWDDPGAQGGTIKTLPNGVFFDLAPPAPPPPAAPAPNACALRFTRLGMYQDTMPPARPALPVCAVQQVAMNNAPGGTAITLVQPETGLRRVVTVRGGRVEAQK
jgi:prepilin-type N-terminal cleavage/methylation domain-containing protein